MKRSLVFGVLACVLAACTPATPDQVLAKSFGDFSAEYRCMDWKKTQRCYYVVPPATNPKHLLIALHPAFTPVSMTENVAHLARELVPQGYLLVYPEGIDRQWNDGRVMEKVTTYRAGTDDVGFIDAVTAKIQKEYGFTANTTTVAGMSNGGMMSLRLACQSDRYGSVATVVANLPEHLREQCHATPKPMVMIFGMQDAIVDYAGGALSDDGVPEDWGVVESARDTEAFFAQRNGCQARKTHRETLADPTIDDTQAYWTRYSDCRQPLSVVHVEGMGHTWPGEESRFLAWISGRGAVSKQFSAGSAIRDFIEHTGQ